MVSGRDVSPDGSRQPAGARRGGRGARGARGGVAGRLRGRGRAGGGVGGGGHSNNDVSGPPLTPPDRKRDGERDTFTGHSTISGLSSASSLERLLGSEGELDSPDDVSAADNINVVVRVRPISSKEERDGDSSAVKFPGEGQIWVEGPPGTASVSSGASGTQKPKTFTYNVVFEPEATQEDVLDHSGIKRLIEMALDGFCCTVFCYGQTGSGKTHTLTGPPQLFSKTPNPYHPDHGLVFRSFVHLFQQVEARKDCQFVLKASFLEIYNEKVIDLLNPGSARKPLAVRWSKKSRGFFVENLFTVECAELDDLLAVLEEGMRNRAVGAHNMNEYSSRSHTILTVFITSEQQASEEGVFISRHGKLNFVDLAGSEMTKKTHSEGKTLEEANNINKSLMVLGYCIASLSDPKKRTGHIPYRDSKLTKLLADSLAGNGVTLMIACISPARSNLSETLNTLRYAARAKRIRTKPVVVMDPREALILSLKREVTTLRSENTHLRNLLKMPDGAAAALKIASLSGGKAASILSSTPPPPADMEKLLQMDVPTLAEMVHQYLMENEALRTEAAEAMAVRDVLLRDQQIVSRENERLIRKLEDVSSSPIETVRPEDLRMHQNGMANGVNGNASPLDDIMYNSDGDFPTTTKLRDLLGGSRAAGRGRVQNGRGPTSPNMPDSVKKEMERRNIGKSMGNIAESYKERAHRRQNSWDGSKEDSPGAPLLPPVRGQRVPQTSTPPPLPRSGSAG